MTQENKPENCTYKGECLRHTISCEFCKECSFKLKELNPEIADFFWATCERFRK